MRFSHGTISKNRSSQKLRRWQGFRDRIIPDVGKFMGKVISAGKLIRSWLLAIYPSSENRSLDKARLESIIIKKVTCSDRQLFRVLVMQTLQTFFLYRSVVWYWELQNWLPRL